MGKKIGILIENRFIEKEIFYYLSYFRNEGYEPVLLTRLWGQKQLTFKGLEFGAEVTAEHSFEDIDDNALSEYAAVIAPAGYVSDYLLYAEKPHEISPACAFIKKIMEKSDIIKGFICHSLWIAAPVKEAFEGRTVTCHNNIIAHAENAGMLYTDKDVCIDGDLITARTGGDHAALAKTILENLKNRG